ncbi:MAG: hypothetical protein RMM17_00265 [Acidobacteriota bacterium]|nr:hypothetical protein [Blastocatellia bacterium]MDW8411099.1 hypothetical protein [Acidobacteriota bacterium]
MTATEKKKLRAEIPEARREATMKAFHEMAQELQHTRNATSPQPQEAASKAKSKES